MTEHLETPIDLCGRSTSPLFEAGTAHAEDTVAMLDAAIPLQQAASHADVVEYTVEIPMRYAECFALLSDGRKVGLQDAGSFIGWSRHDRTRSLLFRSHGEHYEIAVEAGLHGHAPGCIRRVYREAISGRHSNPARKFIGIDGNVVSLP